jgi:hypothetical protein
MSKIKLSILTALTLAHMATTSCIYAAEGEKERTDEHHDRVLRGALNNNHFIQDHFFVKGDAKKPIYDINAAKMSRIEAIHQHHLKRHAEAITTHSPITAVQTPLPTASETSRVSSFLYYPTAILSSPAILARGIYANWPASLSFSKSTAPQEPVLGSQTNGPKSSQDGLGTPSNASPSKDTTITSTVPVSVSPPVNVSPQKDSSSQSTPVLPVVEDVQTRGLKNPKKQRIIVAGDGGGVRGAIPLREIEYLEKQTNKKISDFADDVIGTSIFGIIALGLTMDSPSGQPWSGSEGLAKLKEISARVFAKNSSWNVPAKIWSDIHDLYYTRFSSVPLREELIGNFKEAVLKNARANVMVLTINSKTNTPFIITNKNNPDALAWEVGLAGSAASTFFEAVTPSSILGNLTLVDAGLYANNPAFEGYLGAKVDAAKNQELFNPVLLSLGTGQQPVTPIPNDGGKLNSMAAIVESCIDTSIVATHNSMKMLLTEGKTYFRAQPKLKVRVSLDSLDHYDILMEAAETQFDVLDNFIEAIRPTLEAL